MILPYVLLISLVAMVLVWVLGTSTVFHACLGLLCIILGNACIYLLQGATFVAFAYLITYGGSILLMLLFSVFMVSHEPHGNHHNLLRWDARIFGGLVAIMWGGNGWPMIRHAMHDVSHRLIKSPAQEYAVTALGYQLIGPYGLAFEWVGISLLIVLVGIVHIMQSHIKHPPTPPS